MQASFSQSQEVFYRNHITKSIGIWYNNFDNGENNLLDSLGFQKLLTVSCPFLNINTFNLESKLT